MNVVFWEHPLKKVSGTAPPREITHTLKRNDVIGGET